ncbi:hypothetical protein FBU59_001273 [Linderina macrospora]|uniref:Uncharacterized protein n=1 Tax=Linderina macrospora TaxID=4868 RepID=A0ACC1JER5_9FUNG|nr:hypothetical protein FBU59_001273 [Linderina macrospora]
MELSFAQENNDNKDNKDNEVSTTPTKTTQTKETQTKATSSATKSDSRARTSAKTDEATKDEDSATDDNKDNNENSDEKTADDEKTGDVASTHINEEEMESEFPQAGSISFTTPEATLAAMFPIGTEVEIGWKVLNSTWRPPKKISVCGRLPSGVKPAKNNIISCDWMIATNISGSRVNVTWNTVTQSPPGMQLRESSGYSLYIYDSDLGFGSYRVKPGQAIQASITFSMYNSRYDRTNEGVPKGYNPSAAPPAVRAHIWGVLGVAALALLGAMA